MTRQALNTMTRTQGYNATAVMLGRAFDYAEETMRASDSVRRAKREALGLPVLNRHQLIEEYVHDFSSDRRYKLHWKASTDSSAILEYRGTRYYIEGVYDSERKTRDYYVYRA